MLFIFTVRIVVEKAYEEAATKFDVCLSIPSSNFGAKLLKSIKFDSPEVIYLPSTWICFVLFVGLSIFLRSFDLPQFNSLLNDYPLLFCVI